MLMIASTTILITPENLQVKATGEGSSSGNENNVRINTTYIHFITQNLSDIVYEPGNSRGRSFGTQGEHDARDRLVYWMNQIGLYNVHTEEITGTAQHLDLNKTLEIVSLGIKINGTQTITDFYISPRWNRSVFFPNYNKNILTCNFSESDPLPVYRKPDFSCFDDMFTESDFLMKLLENITLQFVYNLPTFMEFCKNYAEKKFNFTYENYNESDAGTHPSFFNESIPEPLRGESCLYIDEDQSYNPDVSLPSGLDNYESLSLPRVFYKTVKLILQMGLFTNHCKGLILYDFNNDTHDMLNGLFMARPILFINGSIGRPIYENATNTTPSNREISFWINQRYNTSIKSTNVIGQINGTNPNKTILVDCLYDCWWNQGTSDAAIGMSTVLALAKYFKENEITPKYTLKFIAFGGEEYGYIGAQYYNDTHLDENITMVIDLNQIGFSQTGPLPQTFFIHLNNASLISLIQCITNDTYYEERTGTPFLHIGSTYYGAPSDDHPFAVACFNGNRSLNTICFLKDMNWTLHHRDGQNHERGDIMTYYNETDVNVTAEMIWNITKYFTVNPDCWFSKISFTPFDSPNDGDTLNDSIRTNFTIHSILPSDRVRVELDLAYNISGESGFSQEAGRTDYAITSRSQNCSYIFTIPDTVTDGYYQVSFKLYNSTGRINKIVNGSSGTYYNDSSDTSNWFHLYHPLGYTKVGNSAACVDDRICGSVFTANENGYADNITAYINQAYMSPGPYQCMLYRASNGVLIGNTTSDWVSLPQGNPASSAWWAVFNFTGEKPFLMKGTQYIITCWGNSSYSLVYYNESGSSSTGRYYNHTYGTPPLSVEFSNEPRFYSIYCSYSPVPPMIRNVTATPHTVGFGYNVTITANVSDNGSGVSQVTVQLSPPVGPGNNYTMTHGSGDTYYYVFTDTWVAGQYNYTIWAISNSSNMNSSSGHHFHVSADASISIATLKDMYSGEEYINITDPPNPPENLMVVGRGFTWDKYYNAVTGQNILEVCTGPINYQGDNGMWTPINTTINQLESNHPAYVYGYRNGNDHGLYGVYFKANTQNEWPVTFTYNRSDQPTAYAVRSKLLGVGYVDPASNWTYQYLQDVQNSQGQTNDNSITYEDVFTGTDVTWTYGNTGLKEEITLSNATKTVLESHPPSQYDLNNESSYLVFIIKLDYQNLDMYNDSGLLTGNITISDAGIDFKDALGQFKCSLPLGEAYELNNKSLRQKLTYRIVHLNNNTYLLSGLKVSDLTMMTFPVVIDPSMTIYSTSSDGYLFNSSFTYTTVQAASSGNANNSGSYISIGQKKESGFPSLYRIYRGFVLFNTSVLPSNAYLDNATLSLYKQDDCSTTDFDITIQNGQPTYPHDSLQSSDYNKNDYSGNGGTLNTSGFTTGYNAITLNNLSWINMTGTTKLCLRSSRDINGKEPTGNEYVNIYSSNYQETGYLLKLVIAYRNQSKIKNTGSTNIKGYLLMQVQYFDEGQFPPWIVDIDGVNETSPRTITSGDQLPLDLIFNGLIRASDLTHGEGTYRVYAAFRDPDGNILRTNDDMALEAWWQFSKT
jgi:hypothetical protein